MTSAPISHPSVGAHGDAGTSFIDAVAEAVFERVKHLVGERQRLMDVEDAARYLGMTVHALRHKVSAGEIPVLSLDSKNRFDVRDLDRMIDHGKRRGV